MPVYAIKVLHVIAARLLQYLYVDNNYKCPPTNPYAATTGPPASPPIKITLFQIQNECDNDQARDVRVG